MADDAGNIYIADKDAHAVRRIDPEGRIHTVAGTSVSGDDGDEPGDARTKRLASPNGLWVAGNGTLYVLDLGNGKVRRVSPDGQMTTLFHVPNGIAIGRSLWVNDDESRAFVASGTRILEWTKNSGEVRVFSSGFRSLGHLVVDPDGKLVATDRSAGRVYRLDRDGAKRVIAGNGKASGGGHGQAAVDSSLGGVRAVWFDDRGGMFLGTHETSRVWYVGPDGTLQKFLGDGEVDEVRGLSIDANGTLVIVDDDHGFVRLVPRLRAE
jgi:YD repeat-containing protein